MQDNTEIEDTGTFDDDEDEPEAPRVRAFEGWVAVCGNRRVTPFAATENECNLHAAEYNASRTKVHPDTEGRVLHVEDYIEQLEAAIVSLEGQYKAQKAHMKQLWGKRPVKASPA